MFCIRILVVLLLLLGQSGLQAAEQRFVYPPPEASGDERHSYYWQLLEAALAANRDKYGDFSVAPFEATMTFQRASAEVEAGGGSRQYRFPGDEPRSREAPAADPHSARQGLAGRPRLSRHARYPASAGAGHFSRRAAEVLDRSEFQLDRRENS